MTPDSIVARIRRTFGQLLPQSCGMAVTQVKDYFEQLPLDERSGLHNAVPQRRAEFSAGRIAAREAMRIAELPEAVILRGKNGAPQWPKNVVGSIAHNRTYAVAVAATTENIRAIGIDIECENAVTESLWPQILSPRELNAVRSHADPIRQASAIFSLKEAFYKYQYPITGVWLDFLEVEVAFDADKVSSFHSANPACAGLPPPHGAYTFCSGLVLSSVYCQRSIQFPELLEWES